VVAALVGGVAWLVLFVAFLVLVRLNPRRRRRTPEGDEGRPVLVSQGVPEVAVVGLGVAAFVVGVLALFLLLKQLVPG
jgi:hypothetical protein